MSEETRNWGIEPVPERLHVLGLVDQFLLWSNLGVSLLVIVIGSFLVPGLSLPDAFVAILLGSLIGNLMLAGAGLIGADARVPGMVLMRAPLGRVGSYAPTVLNVASASAGRRSRSSSSPPQRRALGRALRLHGQSVWTVFFGGAAAVLALMGPVGVVRRFIRKFAVYFVLASLVYLTWWALDTGGVRELWNRPGDGGTTIWHGMDLVIAVTVSWVPLIADYTRFARDRRSAFLEAGLGYFVAGTWMLGLGALLVLTRGVSEPTELPASVAAAGLAAALALLAITVDETDEAFANVYSSGVSAQNILTHVPQRFLVGGAAVVATVTARDRPARVPDVPAPARCLLRAAVRRAARALAPHGCTTTRATSSRLRPFGSSCSLRWLVGFLVYQWLVPIGPAWWLDLVDGVRPATHGLDAIGASLPSFATSLALAALAVFANRRAGRWRTSRPPRQGKPPST